MSMGSRLASARKKVNLTQEQVAQRLGVSRQAVSRWESDTACPETEKIVRLARLLEVSCDWLLREEITDPSAPAAPPDPVTRLLRGVLDRKVQLTFYEGAEQADLLLADWCIFRSFEGDWAEVECVSREEQTRHLIPVSSIRTITLRKEDRS